MNLLCREEDWRHLTRLKKSMFGSKKGFLRHLILENILRCMSNSQKWGASWGAQCEAPHKYAWFCMILWGASYYATLYKNKTRPKMRSLKIVSGNVVSVMPVPRRASFWGSSGPNCLGLASYYATLYKNKTRPKTRSLKIASGNVVSVMPCLASPHYEAIMAQIASASFFAKEEPHF